MSAASFMPHTHTDSHMLLHTYSQMHKQRDMSERERERREDERIGRR